MRPPTESLPERVPKFHQKVERIWEIIVGRFSKSPERRVGEGRWGDGVEIERLPLGYT